MVYAQIGVTVGVLVKGLLEIIAFVFSDILSLVPWGRWDCNRCEREELQH